MNSNADFENRMSFSKNVWNKSYFNKNITFKFNLFLGVDYFNLIWFFINSIFEDKFYKHSLKIYWVGNLKLSSKFLRMLLILVMLYDLSEVKSSSESNK